MTITEEEYIKILDREIEYFKENKKTTVSESDLLNHFKPVGNGGIYAIFFFGLNKMGLLSMLRYKEITIPCFSHGKVIHKYSFFLKDNRELHFSVLEDFCINCSLNLPLYKQIIAYIAGFKKTKPNYHKFAKKLFKAC